MTNSSVQNQGGTLQATTNPNQTLQQTVQNDLSKSWQGWVAAGIILVAGGYAVYKLMKW